MTYFLVSIISGFVFYVIWDKLSQKYIYRSSLTFGISMVLAILFSFVVNYLIERFI